MTVGEWREADADEKLQVAQDFLECDHKPVLRSLVSSMALIRALEEEGGLDQTSADEPVWSLMAGPADSAGVEAQVERVQDHIESGDSLAGLDEAAVRERLGPPVSEDPDRDGVSWQYLYYDDTRQGLFIVHFDKSHVVESETLE